ncbi:MAG TPA: alpha/beta fold hydrolase [Acidimicrobiales bacterium]|nr:alpha/beta fold hydrolase [Acidimicrobiales bacterium]
MPVARLVLVHGAFHGAWCWDRLTPELDRLGVRHEAVELPFTSAEGDVAAVRDVIDRIDEPVALLGHSFGGAVINAAAMKDGKPYGTTSSLVFLTAFMSEPGQVVDYSGAPGMEAIAFDEDTVSIDPQAARSVFYHRCSSDDSDWATARLRPMPSSVFIVLPVPVPSWRFLPSTYIVCTDDQILSRSAQRQMAGNADHTFEIDSDHSPFLSCSEELARVLHRITSDEEPG